MRYFKFTYDNGYYTGDEYEYVEFDDDVTKTMLNNYGADTLYMYAESYEHLALGWNNDDIDEDERDAYYENCDFFYEEVTKEEYMENCEE